MDIHKGLVHKVGRWSSHASYYFQGVRVIEVLSGLLTEYVESFNYSHQLKFNLLVSPTGTVAYVHYAFFLMISHQPSILLVNSHYNWKVENVAL